MQYMGLASARLSVSAHASGRLVQLGMLLTSSPTSVSRWGRDIVLPPLLPLPSSKAHLAPPRYHSVLALGMGGPGCPLLPREGTVLGERRGANGRRPLDFDAWAEGMRGSAVWAGAGAALGSMVRHPFLGLHDALVHGRFALAFTAALPAHRSGIVPSLENLIPRAHHRYHHPLLPHNTNRPSLYPHQSGPSVTMGRGPPLHLLGTLTLLLLPFAIGTPVGAHPRPWKHAFAATATPTIAPSATTWSSAAALAAGEKSSTSSEPPESISADPSADGSGSSGSGGSEEAKSITPGPIADAGSIKEEVGSTRPVEVISEEIHTRAPKPPIDWTDDFYTGPTESEAEAQASEDPHLENFLWGVVSIGVLYYFRRPGCAGLLWCFNIQWIRRVGKACDAIVAWCRPQARHVDQDVEKATNPTAQVIDASLTAVTEASSDLSSAVVPKIHSSALPPAASEALSPAPSCNCTAP